MGLLDEAIREHLEARRLRGIDPGELAREEDSAFGASEEDLADRPDDDVWGRSPANVAPAEVPAGIAAGGREQAVYASQETVEIDMAALLGVGADHTDGSRRVGGEANRDIATPVSAGVASRPPSLESELDQLDWEVSRPLAGRARRDGDPDR